MLGLNIGNKKMDWVDKYRPEKKATTNPQVTLLHIAALSGHGIEYLTNEARKIWSKSRLYDHNV